MKTIVIHESGGPEVLRCEDWPEPRSPGEGEVLIRMHAAGLNFADHLIRIGAYGPTQRPTVPGLEGAGVIEAVGPGVSGIVPGQRVMARADRTHAELALAPTWAVLPIPSNLSFEQAAAIPVVFGTAWHALVTTAQVRPGERVLVHSAGSGVGSAALQLAKQLGCWVVATAGQDWKLERARELGADAVVNYATQDVAAEVRAVTQGPGVDVALEGVGKATFPASIASLADGGRLVVYGSPSGPRVELDTRLAISRNLSVLGMSIISSPRFPETFQEFGRQALPWFESGDLEPIVDRVYPLEDAAEAHRRLMDRAQFGKLVLRV